MNRIKIWIATAAIALAAPAFAAWPEKPITVIVPYPAGGLTDAVARVLAEDVQRQLGQPLIIESRPGAAGKIGLEQLLRAPRDGYTIAVTVPGLMVFSPLTDKTFKLDPLKDFEPLSMSVDTYTVLVAHPSVAPQGTLPELRAYAKANAGKLNYGTPGAGSSFHFNSIVLNERLGIDATHVPYKGEAPALIDLAGGSLQYMLAGQSARPYLQDGRIKAVAVAASQRVRALPNVPTLTELGVDFKTDGWVGFVAASGVPRPILDRLSEALRTAAQSAKAREQFLTMGYEPVGSTREEFRALIESRISRYGAMIRSGAVKLDKAD